MKIHVQKIGMFILLSGFFAAKSYGQATGVAINTSGADPHTSALLDVSASDKGVLVPRMTQIQRDAITSPASGLLIYQTDNGPGFYFYSGTAWTKIVAGTEATYTAGTGIGISSNTITNSAPDQPVTLTAGTGISVSGTYPSFTVTNSSPSSGGTVTSIATGDGITGGTITSSGTLGLTGQALALHNLSTDGIITRTGSGTVAARSIGVSGTGLSVTNGDGVSGNPTIASNATNANTASTIVARDASGNFSAGTITAALSGNATTATTLQNARNINGTSFDGSANITTANWGTARTLTLGSTGKSVDGSANVSWTLAEIGAAASSHTHAAGDIASGILPIVRGGTGFSTYSSNVFLRSNSLGTALEERTPAQVLSDIGAATSTHVHSTSDITSGTLSIARGGTNTTTTPTNGGIAYGTGTAYAFSAAGASGQVLRSSGAAAPTWADAGSLLTAGTGISISTNTIGLTGQALALHNLGTNGIVSRTGLGTVAARSIAVSGTGLSVTNGDGVSGNPTIISNATNTNTASSIVARDGNGAFSSGNINIYNSGSAGYAGYIWFTNGTTGTQTTDGGIVGMDGNVLRVTNYEADRIAFATNNTERLTIDNSGQLFVTGGLRGGYRSVTSSTILDKTDYYIHVGGGVDITITFPSAAAAGAGATLYFRTQFSLGTKTFQDGNTGAQEIRLLGGATLSDSFTIVGGTNSHRGMIFISDGLVWNQISNDFD